MKKYLVFIICFLFSQNSIFAQRKFLSEEIRISWHSRTSIQMSNILGSYTSKELKPVLKSGPALGGYFSVALNDHWAFEPGVSFSVKGSRNKIDFTTVIGTSEMTYTSHEEGIIKTDLFYAEWPILLVYRMESKVSLGAGCYFGMLLKARYSKDITLTQINNGSVTTTIQRDRSSDISDFSRKDAGISLTAGYMLRDGLELSAFYNKGMFDMKHPKSEFRNVSFGLSIACRIQQF